jgi:ketosteroid isomerase-like protein
MSTANVEAARRGYEAIVRGDLDAVGELLDPEVKWHAGDPTAEGTCQNREQALRFMSRPERPQPVGALMDVIDAGDRVVVIMRPPGSPSEPGLLHANLTTFRDGKVVEMIHYDDPQDALAAAGLPRQDLDY